MARLRLAAGCCGSCSLWGGHYPASIRKLRGQRRSSTIIEASCKQVRRGAIALAYQAPRRRFNDGPPKRPGGFGQRWPRRAIKSFQNLPKNQKRTRLNALLVFPCCRAGATPLVRWALFVLASRFASTPYLAPGSGLCEASPVALPLIPHPGGCAVSTRRWPKRFLYSAATRAGAVFTQACHLQERVGAGSITWHPSRDASVCCQQEPEHLDC